MASINILIVDDSDKFRKLIGDFLKVMGGFNIIGEAENGQQAINTFENEIVDLILMDINMPEMNGIEATKALHKNYAPNLKIIGLSQHNEIDYMQCMIEAGANGYVLKEEMGQQLLDAIKTVINGGVYFPELTI